MDNLHALVTLHQPDAVCIVESWLCPDIAAAEISLPGYNTVRLDTDRHGGGIVLFVADVYNVKVLQQGPLDLEFLLVSVQCAHFRLSLAVLYRPPSSSVLYLDNLYNSLESVHPSYFSNFVLVGDFNIDFCNPSHILYQRLLTILSSFSLTQVVPSPTHTSSTGKSTLIDLALVSSAYAANGFSTFYLLAEVQYTASWPLKRKREKNLRASRGNGLSTLDLLPTPLYQ